MDRVGGPRRWMKADFHAPNHFLRLRILKALFAAFHLLLGWSIQRLPSLAPSYRALVHALNVGGVLMIAFLAVAFLACQADLGSRLGRATILLGALVYLTRGLDEFAFFPHANWATLAIGVITGALHLAALRAAPAA